MWKQVQVRISDVDHHACGNDYNIHFIHNTVRDNYDLMFKDDDDVIVNHHASDIVHDGDLVESDYEETSYASSLVPYVLSSLGTTSIVDDCDPVSVNDHCMIQCDNTSPTISSLNSLTSSTILFLSSLETSSSSNCDTCVGCNSHNEVNTDLVIISVHLSPITSISILFASSSSEPTSLSSNLFRLSRDYSLACLRYVPVALVASLATTSSLSRSLSSSSFSSPSVLDYRFVSYWLSSNAYVLDTIGSSFIPSNVSAFVNLHQLSWVLSSESSHFFNHFASSTTSFYNF